MKNKTSVNLLTEAEEEVIGAALDKATIGAEVHPVWRGGLVCRAHGRRAPAGTEI